MLITRECDYAIRIIRALSSGEITSVQTICELEQLTSPIAYKIARKLEKAGILKSYRGSTGGYALHCQLDKITLYDVFCVIDPNLVIIDCVKTGYECSLHTPDHPCHVHKEFCRIQKQLIEELQDKSLASILHD